MSDKSKKTIFLIEDDNLLAEMYKTKFTMAGYNVQTCDNAESCLLDLKKGAKPNIFLVDILLPGMNGLQLIKEIRKQPQYNDVPIVILTNLHPAEVDLRHELSQSLGIVGFYVKSQISPRELVGQVTAILEEQK
jgi:DNA-binding response OmpR family regulator